MSTFNPAKTLQPVFACEFGNRVVFNDSVQPTATVVLGIGDVVNICKIPNGTLVDRVIVQNPDLDTSTTLQFKLGFAPTDGSSAPSSMASPDVAVAADGATTWQAAATTTYEIFPPYRLDTECYLQAVVSAAATGVQAGTLTIYGKVEGETLGQK
jgi:hypothetical protein